MKQIFGFDLFTEEEKTIIKAALEHYEAAVHATAHNYRSQQQWMKPLNPHTFGRYKELSEEIDKCENVVKIIKKIKL